MFWSKVFLPTLKDTPQDAEVISHQLMLRSGMIRRVTSGIYTWPCVYSRCNSSYHSGSKHQLMTNNFCILRSIF